MPASFYQALFIFTMLVGIAVSARFFLKNRIPSRIRKEIKHRSFAESPTFVMEHLELRWTAGFYTFRIEGIVASTTDSLLEIRIIEGTHSGTAFLTWKYHTPDIVAGEKEWRAWYPKPDT